MATISTNPPKQKRRNSEKRKEKSRDAARCRRSKESEIFSDLSEILPMPSSVSGHLDKASIMRLCIAYLRARNLLGDALTSNDLKEEQLYDVEALNRLVPKILEGFLLVLSVEGDIVYVTEDVSQHLGLPQVDLIGQSIYDYSHPCDHNEVKDSLASRADGLDLRSFFLRFKCTLTNKGRSVNLKSATYKVIHCAGRFVSHKEGSSQNDYLVLVGEPIPHPSNIEGPLDRDTFLTKHNMDMKYIYVDDKITQFLGYKPKELEGKSAFEFHHVLDNEPVLKHYKTMVTKGQSQTPAYRFLASNGGYVWVHTQSTVIYGSRDSRPQAVVCLHKVLSEIEEPHQILSMVQSPSTEEVSDVKKALEESIPVGKTRVEKALPKTSTSKMFAPRTADMDKGYLLVNDINGGTVFKDEVEDLTHLAPKAGDACIPLEIPIFSPLDDIYQDLSLPMTIMDCVPLTGFDFSANVNNGDISSAAVAAAAQEQESAVSVTASLFSRDPFFFVNRDDPCGSSDHSISELFSPLAAKTPETYEEYIGNLSSPPKMDLTFHEEKLDSVESFLNLGLDPTSAAVGKMEKFVQNSGITIFTMEEKTRMNDVEEEEEDFKFRAPFIPMGDADLPLFSCDDILMDYHMDNYTSPGSSILKDEAESVGKPAETTWPFAKSFEMEKIPNGVTTADNKLSANLKRLLVQSEDDFSNSSQLKRHKVGKPQPNQRPSALEEKQKLWMTEKELNLGHEMKKQPEKHLLKHAWSSVSMDEDEPLVKKRDTKTLPSSSILSLLTAQQDDQYQNTSSPLLSLLKRPALWKPVEQQQSSKPNREAVVFPLLGLTSYDYEVNAPLQPATGLLQGEDLLKALDVPLNFETSDQ